MSVHRGVSCNNCQKNDFNGKRYKCLKCYDYDLCGECYDAGRVSERHLNDHPVQCILTNADFSLYYGGENLQTVGQVQSFTCPLCAKTGFAENTLKNHVLEHPDEEKFQSVLCPMCCTTPGNDNEMCQDISTHLMLEHSPDLRELALLFDEPERPRRRIPNSSSRMTATLNRSRHSNSQQSSSGRLAVPLDDHRFPNLLMLLLDRAELRNARRNAHRQHQHQQQQQQQQNQLQQQSELSRALNNTRRLSTDHVIADRLSLVPELDHAANLLPIHQDQFLQSSLIVEAASAANANANNNHAEVLLPMIPERKKSEATVTITSLQDNNNNNRVGMEQHENRKLLLPDLIQEKEKEGLATRRQRAERAMFARELLLSSIVSRSPSSSSVHRNSRESLHNVHVHVHMQDKNVQTNDTPIPRNEDPIKDCVLS